MNDEQKDIYNQPADTASAASQPDATADADALREAEERRRAEEQDERERKEHEEAIKAIRRFTEDEGDDEESEFGEISVKSILGGDILQSRFVVKQVLFVMFLVLLSIIYTGNRYNSQQDILTIDSLKIQLQEERYKVLTIESELLNASRQSEIVSLLKQNGDSLLLHTTTPPIAITPDEE